MILLMALFGPRRDVGFESATSSKADVYQALPFKLIFFVLVDGWSLVAGSPWCRAMAGRLRPMPRYLAASTRFNPTIAGSEPVGNGSAFTVSGGSALAVASGNRVRISRRKPSSVSTLAAILAMSANPVLLAVAGWLAVSKAERVGLGAHQWRIFLAEARQADGVLCQRVADHRADHVALLQRV